MEHVFLSSDNNFLRACLKCCGVHWTPHSSLKVNKAVNLFSLNIVCYMYVVTFDILAYCDNWSRQTCARCPTKNS